MGKRIAVIVAAAVLLPLGACAQHHQEGKAQNSWNDAGAITGTGNTAGQSAAAGASVNSSNLKEEAKPR